MIFSRRNIGDSYYYGDYFPFQPSYDKNYYDSIEQNLETSQDVDDLTAYLDSKRKK